MAKTRAYGSDVILLAGFESAAAYGVAPDGSGGGVYTQLGFKSSSLGAERDLGYDPLLGQGRDAQDPYFEAENVSGAFEFPLNTQSAGFILKGLFGDPVTVDNGDGSYTHTYKSGGAVPSLTMEIGHPALATPKYLRNTGVKMGSLSFDMARTGPANCNVDVIAQGEENFGVTVDAAPKSYSGKRFSQGSGTIKVAGGQLANVTGGSLSFSNNLEAVETIRADGKIDGVDETEATAEGSVTVRFSTDSTIPDAVAAEAPVAFEYAYTVPGINHALTFELPRVFLPKKKQEIQGVGGIQASYDWRAASDSTAGYMLRVTLTNDVPNYAS